MATFFCGMRLARPFRSSRKRGPTLRLAERDYRRSGGKKGHESQLPRSGAAAGGGGGGGGAGQLLVASIVEPSGQVCIAGLGGGGGGGSGGGGGGGGGLLPPKAMRTPTAYRA